MVLKSCRRFLIFSLFFISLNGYSQSNTRINSNTDGCTDAVENKNPASGTNGSVQPSASGLAIARQAGVNLASIPAMLARVSVLQLENYLPLQFKYAILMNEAVEKIGNTSLYQTIDEWFGTRYRFGGTTHKGIDCSAFMQKVAQYAFGWALPRTAREQYSIMRAIAREDIHEGDFVFFNTHGGVSHVGMCLQNNKFVHSSTSSGVMISDLSDKYWAPRIVGFKRMESGNTHTSMN